MFPGLKGKTALITGSSRGIGRAIALELACQGCTIVVNYHTHREKAEEVEHLIKELGQEVVVAQADVSNPDDVDRLRKITLDSFANLDILVNNAGIHQHKKSWELTVQDWERILQTNLTGIFLCSRAFIPQFRKNNFGRIINISSVVAHMGTDHECHYASSKAGILGITKSLALELAPYNVTVNAIAPGYIQTDMTQFHGEKEKGDIEKTIPLGRIGDPCDIAYATCFLASRHADYITGETVNINGGLVLE